MSFPLKDPLEVLALLVLLMLLVPRLCRRFRLPPIVGLILAGVLLGPHGLKIMGETDGLRLLSTTGLLYIMFLAGLEIDLNQVRKRPQSALVFGGFTFFIPWMAGIVLGRYFFEFSWLASVLLGSLFSSHTLIPYPVVSRLGLSRDPAVNATVGGTILTDTMALLVLAVAARIHGGEMTVLYGFELALGAGILIALSIYLLPRFGRWFYRNLPIGEDTAEFLFLFANLLVFSVLAHLAGLEPIIGAFLAGMSLNPLVPQESRLMNRAHFVGDAIFIPIFLISVGMIVDLRALLFRGLGWQVAVGMTIAVLATKFLAAQATRRVFKYDRDQTWVVFGLSVNQAAATLAAVMVGHRIGLLNDAVLNGTILMILVTCLVGPWITEVYARRYALGLSRTRSPSGPGSQRIMMTLTRPDDVVGLMDLTTLIRDPESAHPVYPLSVAIEGPGVNEQLATFEKLLGQSVLLAAATDIPIRAETRIDTNEAIGVDRAVRELRVSCLLAAWDGKAGGHVIFGRILDRILCQVRKMIIVPYLQQPLNTFQRVVAVFPPLCDRLPGFDEALQVLRNLLKQANLNLLVVCPGEDLDDLKSALQPLPPDSRFVALDSASRQWAVLDRELQGNDLLTPFSCRPDSLAWQPGLDRLPQRLRSRFPKASLLFVYPSETAPSIDAEDPEAGATASQSRQVLSRERFFPGLQAKSGEAAIREQLGRYFETLNLPLQKRIDSLTSQLLPSALEIQPGMTILHIHCQLTDEPLVLLGTSLDGVAFPEIANPCHAIFLLLSPEDARPEEHLKALGELAHLAMRLPGADKMATVESFENLQALLDEEA